MAERPRNRGWIWYFVLLAVLTTAATASLIVYNLRQQLQPEQLVEARKLWKEKGPSDYRLDYTVQKGTDAGKDRYSVLVRGGKVVAASVNGQEEPAERFRYYGIPALFDFMEDFLEIDTKKGKKNYSRALFATDDGHPLWYVRRVMGTSERVEIHMDDFQIPGKD